MSERVMDVRRGRWAADEVAVRAHLERVRWASERVAGRPAGGPDRAADFDFLADLFPQRSEFRVDEDGVAYVDVRGMLLNRPTPLERMLGTTGYDVLTAEVEGAVSVGARGLVLTIDSPGGMVSGLEEAADAVAAASERMPVAAWCTGLACSAAYYLAAGADRVVSSASAEVGNIGTVLAWYDDSEWLESLGVRREVLVNEGADLKGTFRDSPMTAAQREFLQDSVDEGGAEFRAWVEGNRPGVAEEVFRAGWYGGRRAMDLGLVDEVGGLERAKAAVTKEEKG